VKRHLTIIFLSDTLLLAFASAWLLLILIPMLLMPSHWVGMWYESNLFILVMEVAICAFAIVWAVARIVSTIKREQKYHVKA
jgi:hypothetical protein